MVEMALVGTALFAILIGIMDFGQFLFCQQAIVERARSAARWGSVTDPTNSDAIRNVVLYGQSTVPAGGQKPFFGLTSQMVSVSTQEPGTDNYRLIVTVSGYSINTLSFLLASRYRSRTVTATAPLGLYR